VIRPSHNPIYWVIVTLVIALLPQLSTMAPHLIPITLFPVAWRLMAEVRGWKPLNIVLRIGITAVTSWALVMTYGSLIGRRAAVSLLSLMLALKLLETFKVRDARIVASLSLFLCATQFLFSQGMLMVVYGAASLITALVSLALLHRAEAFKPVGEAPVSGMNMFSELKFSARLLALAMPVALALFLLFPRWGSPLWGVPEQALDSKTGLSDSMTPGSIQDLFMDDSPAFRAEFHSVIPARSQLYWRGPVFTHFNGETWSVDFYSRNIPAESKAEISTSPWHYTVQLEPTERHSYFALDYPALVPPGVSLTMDYQLYSRRSVTSLKSYEMLSNPAFTDSPTLKSTLRSAVLALPAGFNPRTRELMQEWRSEVSDERELVQRALQHFFTEEFHYTLNPPLLSNDTVDEFLFETRRGFCEHYASTFTVMMRMAGIPARVVTGYQGGWYSEIGNYVLVRQSDAHAWSEVWLEDSGWTRVDPTAAVAPSRIERNALEALGGRRHALDFAWLRGFRNGIDLLERVWNDWVIRFDSGLQSNLLQAFGIDRLGARELVIILTVLVGLLTAIMAPLILRMRRGTRKDRVGKAWIRFRKRLESAGAELSHSMGPRELADSAAGQITEKSAEIHDIADQYTRLRYAQSKPDENEFEQSVRAFRA
jgi:transglutaminase-like putative cysteine protease